MGSFDSEIQCPKCLGQVVVKQAQAGTRVECPGCNASLMAPESMPAESMFDDLFGDSASQPVDQTDGSSPSNDVSLDVPVSNAESETLDEEIAEDVGEPREYDSASIEELPSAGTTESARETQQPVADPDSWAAETPEPFDPMQEAVQALEPTELDELEELEPTVEHTDPFEYNENKPLRVDGVSPVIVSEDAFFMKCPVCESDLQTNKRELGNKVICTDCHSEITIAEPKSKKRKTDQWRKPATVKRTSDSDDEFKLADPVERPQPDMPLGADVGLDSVAGDLLAPRVPEADPATTGANSPTKPRPKRQRKPEQGQTGSIQQQGARPFSQNAPVGNATSKTGKTGAKPKVSAAAKKKLALQAEDGLDLPTTLNSVSKLELFNDADLMIRTLVAVVFLTFSYTMLDSVWKTLNMTELNGGDRFIRYFPAAIGAFVCFAVVVWFMSVTMSVLMRSVANGDKRVREWVGFAPSEWLGSFIAFAFAGWAASVPGGMIGYIAMKLTGVFFLLPMGLAISMFALLPIFFISSFYNESAFNVFAPDILQTVSSAAEHWKSAYISYAILLAGFAIGILILFIPGLLFSFIGAAIQIVALSAFAVMIGLHAYKIIKSMA